MRSLFLSLISISFLAACAGTPKIHPPVAADAKLRGVYQARSAVLDSTDHMTVHLDQNKEIVYSQQFGNSVAVGVLLGPLGVLANVAATEAKTNSEKEKLFGKITASPSMEFSESLKDSDLAFSSTRVDDGVLFSPYLYVVKTKDDVLLLAAALVVEAATPGAAFPPARYMYQLPTKITLEELEKISSESNAKISGELRQGYKKLVDFYRSDSMATFESEKLIKFKSDLLNPRFDFETPGKIAAEETDRVWLRHFFGVASISKSNFQLIGPWE